MSRSCALPVDLSNIDGETLRDLEELYRQELQEIALGEEILLRTIAQDNRQRERSIEGMGSRVLSVPVALATQARIQGETFADPGYRRFVKNRYDLPTPNVGGTKDIMVGYTIGGDTALPPPRSKRFTKTYA